jgi:hypothetical protein
MSLEHRDHIRPIVHFGTKMKHTQLPTWVDLESWSPSRPVADGQSRSNGCYLIFALTVNEGGQSSRTSANTHTAIPAMCGDTPVGAISA